MPVTVKEIVTLKDLEGIDWEGEGVANQLAAIKTDQGNLVFGVVTGLVKVHTKVVCDNPLCINSTVNDEFKTVPATIEFDDSGDSAPEFIRKISQIVITSDYKGVKQAYCSPECCAKFLRRESHNKGPENFGKGHRYNEPEQKAELL